MIASVAHAGRCASLIGRQSWNFAVMPRSAATALLVFALAACTAARDTPRVVADLGKAADALAAEMQRRQAVEPFRGLPVIVRAGANDGAEGVLAELLRTRLAERGAALEIACPAKCVEINLVEFVAPVAAAGAPGELVTLASQAALTTLPRSPGHVPLGAGEASGAFATFAVRDGNRYTARHHLIAWLGVARATDASR